MRLLPILFLISSVVLSAGPYTIKDLEILSEQKSYQEYLDHAKDIRPEKRDRKWIEMTQKMGEGLIADLISRSQIDKESFSKVESLSLWPVFRDDEIFQLAREDYAYRYFDKCLSKTGPECIKEIIVFWKSGRKAPDVGLKLAKLLYGYFPDKDRWSLLEGPLKSEIASFECGNNYIINPLFEKATEVLDQAKTEFDRKVALQNLATMDCWKKIYAPLKEIMHKSPIAQRKEQSFLILNLMGQLNPREKEIYLIEYILDGPRQGETFNLAWNALKRLKESPEARKALLEKLTNREFLPDGLFNLSDLNKKNIVTDLLSETFPEYLRAYAHKCLDFYKGKGSYPRGTPTRYCNDFLKLSNGKDWISPTLILEIKNAKKL